MGRQIVENSVTKSMLQGTNLSGVGSKQGFGLNLRVVENSVEKARKYKSAIGVIPAKWPSILSTKISPDFFTRVHAGDRTS